MPALLAILLQAESDYAVVVSRDTRDAWPRVVRALERKHAATVVVWDKDVGESRARLTDLRPRFACFVARPEEAGRAFVVAVHRLTRGLDDDPYTDVVWGILTGYEEADALRIAERREPLLVRRGVAGTGLPLELFVEGAWYSEGEKNAMWAKSRGGKPEKQSCPDDTTKLLADEISRGCDFFTTSGHATERDWQIGYSYPNGQFRCAGGRLFGLSRGGERFPIEAKGPMVYSAAGNCLAGHVVDREAMALAWMRSGGVHQMAGYTVLTWFGYGGWGVHDYFWTGAWTFAESFFLNQQSLVRQLEIRFPRSARLNLGEYDLERDDQLLNKLARKHGIREKDELGLLWDRDVVAFYGDPAWEARLDRQGGRPFEVTLAAAGDVFTIEVRANADGAWGRPPGAILPRRAREVTLLEGDAVVTDLFVLLPLSGAFKKGEVFRARFRAAR